MIERLVRRLLCRLGHHDVLRCAGAEDHAWRHDGRRWVATLDRVPPATPVARPDVAGAAARRARSAALPCRCDHRQDEHRPAADGGCTACPCLGFALTGREELNLHRDSRGVALPAARPAPARRRHRSTP